MLKIYFTELEYYHLMQAKKLENGMKNKSMELLSTSREMAISNGHASSNMVNYMVTIH
jgi:hypothetical protein